MHDLDHHNQRLASGLAALAGFVDATGFIATGGFFLSFMSGNSTRLGVGVMTSGGHAALAALLILLFVLGVMTGSLVGRAAARWHRPMVLVLLATALALAAGLAAAGWLHAAFLVTAFAMGSENTVFEADGEVRISLTYMTGNLVKIGQRLSGALLGRNRWAFVPFLALWLAMVGGAIAGAAVWPWLGLGGLWLASGAALALAAFSYRLERSTG
jgi:uncharacterized membrane protein YoaK (UPF0700 family)